MSATGSLASTVGVANPYRYRGYGFDVESGLYYLQSRYYNPGWGRLISTDAVDTIMVVSANLYKYCHNNPVNIVDHNGFFGTPLSWALAALGGVLGWLFGDSIARSLHATGAWYWVVRAAVVLGGAAIGFLVGELVALCVSNYIAANIACSFRLASSLGGSTLMTIYRILGVKIFTLFQSSGQFIGFLRQAINSTNVVLSKGQVQNLFQAAAKFGYKLRLDGPEGPWSWHLCIEGLSKLHIQIPASLLNYVRNLLK